MSKRDDGGPAFPVSTRPCEVEHGYGHQDGHTTWQFGGMTLRDYFAVHAPGEEIHSIRVFKGTHSTTEPQATAAAIAEARGIWADAMLAERAKP